MCICAVICNPKGIAPSSPGLPSLRAYPGLEAGGPRTLKGLRQMYATGSRRFMESLLLLRACIGTMNQFEKLRRSAMSIAANAPWSFPNLRRSAIFARRFIESFNVRGTCIVTMNLLKLRIPTGFCLKAQGCRACEAALGWRRIFTILKGLRQMYAIGSPRFMERRIRSGAPTIRLLTSPASLGLQHAD
jgi:hypothetical protein